MSFNTHDNLETIWQSYEGLDFPSPEDILVSFAERQSSQVVFQFGTENPDNITLRSGSDAFNGLRGRDQFSEVLEMTLYEEGKTVILLEATKDPTKSLEMAIMTPCLQGLLPVMTPFLAEKETT
jgi:hypothetical protein